MPDINKTDLVDRLMRERVDKAEAWDAIAAKNAIIASQAAEISRLRDALKPFAEAAEGIDDSNPDRWEMWEHPASMNIHVADMRRARTALEANHG